MNTAGHENRFVTIDGGGAGWVRYLFVVVLGFCVVFPIISSIQAQGDSDEAQPALTVDQFQVDPFRLRDGMDISCRIRNNTWQALEHVRANVRIRTQDGEVRRFPLAKFSVIPAGRVVTAETRIEEISEPEEYRVRLVQSSGSERSQCVYRVNPETSRTEPISVRESGVRKRSIDRGKQNNPSKLSFQLPGAFTDENTVELGHVELWRIDRERMLIQGGVRNGLDAAVKNVDLRFVLTGTGGKRVERSIALEATLKPGEIHPFHRRISGPKELEEISFEVTYDTDPSAQETNRMKWSDVRDRLKRPGEGTSGNTPDHTTSNYPLLSLHGIEKVTGNLEADGQIRAGYLLKLRLTHQSRYVKPRGTIRYQVLSSGKSVKTLEQPLQPNQYQPVPGEFALNDLRTGTAYWAPERGMVYVVLVKVRGIHSKLGFNVRLRDRRFGSWSFNELKPPYMNQPIPSDRVRSK